MGGTLGIYPFAWLFVLPIALFCFFIIGYASVATLSIAFSAIILFIFLAITSGFSWAYVFYAVGSLVLLIWALRPNIKRLLKGNERIVGLRAHWIKKKANKVSDNK